MGQATRTVIDALLKDQYLPPIVDSLPSEVALHDEFKKDSESWSGRQVIRSTRVGRNPGRGSRAEGATLPAAGSQTRVQQIIQARYCYVRVQLTGQAIKSAVNSQAAFTKALTSEVMDGAKDMYYELNRQMQGDGVGNIGVVEGAVSNTTTVEVDYAGASASAVSGEPGTRWIKKDDTLAIGTAAEHAAGTGVYAVVSSVTDRDTFVTTANVTLVDGDIIVRAGSASATDTSYNNEFQGIQAAAVQSGTYQNLNLDTYPDLRMQSLSNSGTNRTLTWNLMQQAIDEAEEFGGGKIDLILAHTSMRPEIIDLAKDGQRYIGTKNLDGGYTGDLTFNGIKILFTKDMKYNRIYFLTRSTWTYYQLDTINWMDEDGSILSRVSGYDSYEALMRCYANLSCDKPSANTVLSDIRVTLRAT